MHLNITIWGSFFFLLNSSMQVDGVCAVSSHDKNISFILLRRVPDVSCTNASTWHGTLSEGQQILIQGSRTWWRNSCFHFNTCRAGRSNRTINFPLIEQKKYTFDENMYICTMYLILKLRHVATFAYEYSHVSQDRNNTHLHVVLLSYYKVWIDPLNFTTVFFKWVTKNFYLIYIWNFK